MTRSTKKEREIALKLFNFGMTKYRIGKILGFPDETICLWLTPGRKERTKKAYADWVKNNPEKAKGRWYDWYKRNKAKYHEKHGHKMKARIKLRQEVRKGRIIKKPCEVCGELKVEAHHEDYSKPLDVIWLCQKHHRIRDKELEL